MARVRTLTLLGLCAALAACGAATTSPPRTATRSATVPATTPAAPANGAGVFTRDCTACHSLIGNESLHKPGGDLIGYHLSRSELELQTREMPVKHPLTAAELTAVVDYVWAAQHRR